MKGNSYYAQNEGKWSILDQKSRHLNFSLNFITKSFWSYTWSLTLKSVLMWLFWIMKENSYYVENGQNGSFLDLKSTLLNIPVNLLAKSFWNYTGWQVLKSVLK